MLKGATKLVLLAAANTGIVVAIIMIVVGIALSISGALFRKTETSGYLLHAILLRYLRKE